MNTNVGRIEFLVGLRDRCFCDARPWQRKYCPLHHPRRFIEALETYTGEIEGEFKALEARLDEMTSEYSGARHREEVLRERLDEAKMDIADLELGLGRVL